MAQLFVRLVFGLSAVIVVLGSLGFSYHSVEASRDTLRFPQIGRSVDVGGFKLNIDCSGKGSPTVVLESGLEDPAVGWRLVQPEIAKFARVCSYDRAGYGWSEQGPMPRTSTEIAIELHKLLQNAGEKGPYMLVGHSFGAANVRIYNGLYPNDVAGVALVDGGYDDLKLPASIQKLSVADLKRRQRDRALARLRYGLGISRFLARKEIEDATSPLADREWWYFDMQPKSIEATTSEVENLALFSARGVQEMKAAGTLGDKPLIVLIAGKGMWGLPLTSQDWVDLQKMWIDGQKQLAQHLSSRGKWIVVSDSTHMMPDERPDAIADAVRDLCAGLHP